jgi:hypothetical protein
MKAQNSDVKQKTATLELDKTELNKLIAALEKAQDAVSNWQA